MKKAKLKVFFPNRIEEFEINNVAVSIGRGQAHNVNIVIEDPTVSRLHARIFVREGLYFLEDLSTFQRTFLNKSPANRATELKDQDEIQFGNIRAKFFLSSEEYNEHVLFTESGSNFEVFSHKNNQIVKQITETTRPENEVTEKIQVYVDEEYEDEEDEEEEDNKDEFEATQEIPDPDFATHGDLNEVQEAQFAAGESFMMTMAEIPYATPMTDKHPKPPKEPALACTNLKEMLYLKKDAVYVGADAKNDLVIESDFFAKVQFSIIANKTSGKYYLKNLGTNETLVNGIPIESMIELTNNCNIMVGSYVFLFFDGVTSVSLYESLENSWDGEAKEITALPKTSGKLAWAMGKVLCDYQIVKGTQEQSHGFFFTKQAREGLYIFLGELYCGVEESQDINLYLVKIQGIFESVLDYGNTLMSVMEAVNRNLYWRFNDVKVHGILMLISSKNFEWISAANAPVIVCGAEQEILPTGGVPLGTQDVFWGKQHRVVWNSEQQFLVFSNSLLASPIKSDKSLLVSIESIKYLFKMILKEKMKASETWSVLGSRLHEKIEKNRDYVFALIRQKAGKNNE